MVTWWAFRIVVRRKNGIFRRIHEIVQEGALSRANHSSPDFRGDRKVTFRLESGEECWLSGLTHDQDRDN